MAQLLFACTKCHKRYSFDMLSGSSMQCAKCRSNSNSQITGSSTSSSSAPSMSVKCTYCREEYTSADDTVSICQKCQQSVKQYGKPRSCEICNIIAAFIGSKCQRCVFSEKKWGSPVSCDQCRQKCAFNRDISSKRKVDGKTLCWLCTIAYKKVMAKARKKDNSSLFSASSDSHRERRKRSNDTLIQPTSRNYKSIEQGKKAKSNSSSNGATKNQSSSIADYPLPDMNIVLVTQLREEVESLKKTIQQKEQLLLEKERKMTELKAEQMDIDKKSREKLLSLQKQHNDTVEILQGRNKDLLKQVAAMSKGKKMPSNGQAGTSSPAPTSS